MSAEPNTYHVRAVSALADEGGRFIKPKATVTGAGPSPPLPTPHWSRDPVPPEPPLGIDVNEMLPVGIEREIERSIRDLGGPALAAPAAATPAAIVETRVGSPNLPIIRRRV